MPRPACRSRSLGPSVRCDQVVECLHALDLRDLKELLAAVRKVLAKVVVDRLAERLQFGL